MSLMTQNYFDAVVVMLRGITMKGDINHVYGMVEKIFLLILRTST
jgi:hypothetical protein